MLFIEPGRHFAASSRPQQRGGGHRNQQYTQPQKGGIDRRQSLGKIAKTSGSHPHLPQSGISRNSGKRDSKSSSNGDFMKTPDPGQSG